MVKWGWWNFRNVPNITWDYRQVKLRKPPIEKDSAKGPQMIDDKIDWTTEAHLLNDLGHDDQEAFEAEVEALTNQRLNAHSGNNDVLKEKET